MTDQYETEDKADKYDLFKKSNTYVSKVTEPTFRKLLGNNLKGKRVIDLACGGADSTKMLADMEPDELVGVDLSSEMIRKAQRECAENPKYSSIKFFVRNCLEPINMGQYDVVFAAHLLNYAEKIDDLVKFYQVMFDSTKEGGISAGVTMNVFLPVHEFNVPNRYTKYGFRLNAEKIEDRITLSGTFMYKQQDLFSVKVWIWSHELHEETARQVGFKRLEWVKPHLIETEKNEDGFWDDYLTYCPTVYFRLYK